MFKYLFSRLSLGLIAITCLYTSCSNNNSYADKRYKIMVDSVYEPIYKPSLEKFDFSNCIRLVDSVYAKEKHKTLWLDKFYYYNLSWMNIHLQNYQLGINYADTLINIIEHNNLKELASYDYSIAYLTKGNGYLGLNNYAQAFQNYFKAKQIADQYSDSCRKVYIIETIAYVLYQQKQYENAKNFYFEGLACINSCPTVNINDEQQTFDDIALCYTQLKQFDSATYYYNLALKNIKKHRYTSSKDSMNCKIRYATCRGVVLGNMAKIFAAQNQLDSSEILYKEAIYLNATIGFEKKDAEICEEQLAIVQLKKNDFIGMKQSLDDLKKGLDSLPVFEVQVGWLELMAAYYQHSDNKKQEIKYYRDFIAMKDSLNLVQKGSKETTITKELKDKEQQFEITVLQKDNQLSKVYLWVIAIACAMAALIAFFVYRNFRKGKKNIITLTNLNNQISEQQKQTEYALQQLEVSNKDKDRILRVVAHDLRNPISGIAAISQSILEQDENIESKELIEMIEKTSTHSLTLINELLQTNTGKNEVLNIQTIDINNVVKQTAVLLNYNAFEKQQKINVSLLPHSLLISIDENKIHRVIGNLINNAIKFSPKKSIINVSINKSETNVIISIKDYGIGIPMEMQPHIFEMFSNAKRKGTDGEKSFGLGLSICKQIIEAHKGNIWVESEVANGSCFYIELPLAQNI